MVSRRQLLARFCAAPLASVSDRAAKTGRTAATALEFQGAFGDALSLWRGNHLWRVYREPSILGAYEAGLPADYWFAAKEELENVVFENGRFRKLRESESRDYLDPRGTREGFFRLVYHGEHLGKWLDATSLALAAKPEPKVRTAVDDSVARLIRTQKPNGYLGTYPEERRFYQVNDEFTSTSWDVWNCRYVLQGLLTYDELHRSPEAVKAAARLGTLLARTFRERSIAIVGTWDGLASSTLLESIVLLYHRTDEPEYLEFARRIVADTEASPKLRTLSRSLGGEDVTLPGRGKAYELMSNLIGYCEMFWSTAGQRFLDAAERGWRRIQQDHLFETGGPWTTWRSGHGRECFADRGQFGPDAVVETCSAATWLQLSLNLLRLTGTAQYAQEAERVLLNHIMGVQAPDGVSWTTHPACNAEDRAFSGRLSCCASNGPRALEAFARHSVAVRNGALVLHTLLPLEARTELGSVQVQSSYPNAGEVTIRLKPSGRQAFPIELVPPFGESPLRSFVNGVRVRTAETKAGMVRVEREWSPIDELAIRFEIPEQTYEHAGFDGKKWRCSMRGPVLLAGETSGSKLKTYYLAGRFGGGYQTLFPAAGNQAG